MATVEVGSTRRLNPDRRCRPGQLHPAGRGVRARGQRHQPAHLPADRRPQEPRLPGVPDAAAAGGGRVGQPLRGPESGRGVGGEFVPADPGRKGRQCIDETELCVREPARYRPSGRRLAMAIRRLAGVVDQSAERTNWQTGIVLRLAAGASVRTEASPRNALGVDRSLPVRAGASQVNGRPSAPPWHLGHRRWKMSEPLAPYSRLQVPHRST